MPDTNELLTIAQAAKEMNVSRQRMHALIKTYGVEKFEPSPKLFMVLKSELDKIPKLRKPGPRANSK